MTGGTISNVTRTILDYLSVAPPVGGPGYRVGGGKAEEDGPHSPVVEHTEDDGMVRDGGGDDDSPATTLAEDIRRRALDLIISQLKDIYTERPRPGHLMMAPTTPSQLSADPAAALASTKGLWACFAEAVVGLLHHLLHRSILVDDPTSDGDGERGYPPPTSSYLQGPALLALIETLCVLCRDRAFQYILLRQWQEAIGQPPSLQEVLLRALLMLTKEQSPSQQSNRAPPPLPVAPVLELWAALCFERPLEVPPSFFPQLTSILLTPLLRATQAEPQEDHQTMTSPSSPSRTYHPPDLLHSLMALGHACRGSPSFRNYVRDHNTREKNRVYAALLGLLSSTQQQDSSTELVLATLGCLARLVAGDNAYEERVFDRRNIAQMSRLVFARLLHGLVYGRRQVDSGTATGELPGEGGTLLQSACANVLSDMLRSPVIRSVLDTDTDQVERFIHRSVAALALLQHPRSHHHSLRSLPYCSRFEAVFRSLRSLCQESFVSQKFLVKALVEQGNLQALTTLVEFVLCPHVPTSDEATSLLTWLFQADNYLGIHTPSYTPLLATTRPYFPHLMAPPPLALSVDEEQQQRLWQALIQVLNQQSSRGAHDLWPGVTSVIVEPPGQPFIQMQLSSPTGLNSMDNFEPLDNGMDMLSLNDTLDVSRESVDPGRHPRASITSGGALAGGSRRTGSRRRRREKDDSEEAKWGAVEVGERQGSLLSRMVEKIEEAAELLSTSDDQALELHNPSVEMEWPLCTIMKFACCLCRREEVTLQVGRILRPRCIGDIVMRLAQLRSQRAKDRQWPEARCTAVLDVVVQGCSLLLQVLLTVKARLAATTDQEEVVEEEGMRGEPRGASLNKSVSVHYTQWLSSVLSSPKVADLVGAAVSHPCDKGLVLRSYELLALAQMRGGPDWLSLADALFHLGQRRAASWDGLRRRLEEAEAGTEALAAVLNQRATALEAEEARREAFQERWERQILEERQNAAAEIQALKDMLREKTNSFMSQKTAMQGELRRLEDRVTEADARLMEERTEKDMAREEVHALRKQLQTCTDLLGQVERESNTSNRKVKSSAAEVQELKQALVEKDMSLIETERRVEDLSRAKAELEGKLEDSFTKLIALAKAYKAKEECTRNAETRLEQLESQVVSAETKLADLRQHLEEKEAMTEEMRLGLEKEIMDRDQELQRFDKDLQQAHEELQALTRLLEEKRQETDGLEAEVARLQEVIHRHESLLSEKDAAISKHRQVASLINRALTDMNVEGPTII